MEEKSVFVVVDSYTPSREDVDRSPVALLELHVGDVILMESSSSQWGYGTKVSESSIRGIFPLCCVVASSTAHKDEVDEVSLWTMNCWARTLEHILERTEDHSSVIEESKHMRSCLESFSTNRERAASLSDINYKYSMPIHVNGIAENGNDLLKAYHLYEEFHTSTVQRANCYNNPGPEYDVVVQLSAEHAPTAAQLIYQVGIVDGRSLTPMFELCTCSLEHDATMVYSGLSIDDFTRRELTMVVNMFEVTKSDPSKTFIRSAQHRIPTCSVTNPNVNFGLQLEYKRQDDTKSTDLRVKCLYEPKSASEAVILKPLKVVSACEFRSQTTVIISVPDFAHIGDSVTLHGQLCLNGGSALEECFLIRTDSGITNATTFSSKVTSLLDYKEIVEIQLPDSDCDDVHLRLTMFNNNDDLMGIAYCNVVDDGALLSDGRYPLVVYATSTPSELRQQGYLRLPSTRRELTQSVLQNHLYSVLDKTTISLTAQSVSTQLFQNRMLMQFLRCNDDHDLVNIIPVLFGINPAEMKFNAAQVLDKVFFLLQGSDNVVSLAFDLLVYILHWSSSGLYQHVTDAVEHSLAQFRHPRVSDVLLKTLARKFDDFIERPEDSSIKLALMKTTGCLDRLAEFVLSAKQCDGSQLQKLAPDFTNILYLCLKSARTEADIWRHVPNFPKLFNPLMKYQVLSEQVLADFVNTLLDGLPPSRNMARTGFLHSLTRSSIFTGPSKPVVVQIIIRELRQVLDDFKSSVTPEYIRLLISAVTSLVVALRSDNALEKFVQQFIQTVLQPIIQIYLTCFQTISNQTSFVVMLATILEITTTDHWISYMKWNPDNDLFMDQLLNVLASVVKEGVVSRSWNVLYDGVLLQTASTILKIIVADDKSCSVFNTTTVTALLAVIDNFPRTATWWRDDQERVLVTALRKLWYGCRGIADASVCQSVQASCSLLADNLATRNLLSLSFVMTDPEIAHSWDETVWSNYCRSPMMLRGLCKIMRTAKNNVYYSSANTSFARLDNVERLVQELISVRKCRDLVVSRMEYHIHLLRVVNLSTRLGFNTCCTNALLMLFESHFESDELAEAAFVLLHVYQNWNWSEDALTSFTLIRDRLNIGGESNAELKRNLGFLIVQYLDEAEHWEVAVDLLKEMMREHEQTLLDYDHVPAILTGLTDLYTKINNTHRMESHYFLISFHGISFSEALRDRSFVIRGRKLEMWEQFRRRLMRQMGGRNDDMGQISRAQKDGVIDLDPRHRHCLITPVSSQPSNIFDKLNASTNPLLAWYYKHHYMDTFFLNNPKVMRDTSFTALEDSEATRIWVQMKKFRLNHSLPGMVTFGQVTHKVSLQVCNPIQVAIFNTADSDYKLKFFAQMLKRGFSEFQVALNGQLRGVLNADVGGGIKRYFVFFSLRNPSAKEVSHLKVLLAKLRDHVAIVKNAVNALQTNGENSELVAFMSEASKDYCQTVHQTCERAAIQLGVVTTTTLTHEQEHLYQE